MIISFLRVKRGSRKCRNWQTSKTKDLVIIAIVWVQVPSSALKRISNRISFFCAEDGLMNAFMITIPCNRVGCGRPVDSSCATCSLDGRFWPIAIISLNLVKEFLNIIPLWIPFLTKRNHSPSLSQWICSFWCLIKEDFWLKNLWQFFLVKRLPS